LIFILIVQAWLEPRVYLDHDQSMDDGVAEPGNDAGVSQDVRHRARKLTEALEALGDEGMEAMVGKTGLSALSCR
jgi:hypothetical protein